MMIEMLNMEALDVVVAGVIICFAAAAQSAAGFGSALFAVPLLVWLGIPLPNVIALVATCSTTQTLMGVHTLRDDVPWRVSFITISVMLVGLVTGLILLKQLATLNPDPIRLVMGCVLIFLVILQGVIRPKPVTKLHWSWGGLAFASAGFLGGVVGMNGPPLVLWSMAHDWSTTKTRGYLFAVFSMVNPIQILLLTLTFGPSILYFVLLGIGFLPLIYLGSRIGLPAGNRMKKETLKRIAFALLLLMGISAAIPVLVNLLQQ